MAHLQNGRHILKSHRSGENAPRLPKIYNNSYRNKGLDAHYSSYKPPYVNDEKQKLKDEIKFLKEHLWRQTDKHAKEIRLLEKLSKDIIELQTNEIQKLETEKRNFERKNYELEKMLNNKNNETDDEKEVWFQESSKRISYLQNELEKCFIKIEAIKSEKYDEEVRFTSTIQALEIKLEQCTQKIKRLEKKIDEREKQLTEARNEILLKKGIATQNERKSHQNVKIAIELQDEINRLNVRLQQMYTTLKDTEVELSETKTRLSKAMGERLTDNNPNIADLNDRNRPTKLAERYAELYDNQWTEAFDVILKEQNDEQDTIETLLKILQDVESFCKTTAREQIEKLRRVLEFSDTHGWESKLRRTLQNVNKRRHLGTKNIKRDIAPNEQKILKDCRKAMSSSSIDNLYQMYVSYLKGSTNKTGRSALNVQDFTMECLTICWYMVVQDPPVSLAESAEKGSIFNPDLYKAYTRSGTHVEYVVWPPLLLYANGPVLMKGVAQGYQQIMNENNNT